MEAGMGVDARLRLEASNGMWEEIEIGTNRKSK